MAMAAAVGLIIGGATGSWIFDERTNVITPEIAQQVAELEELAKTQTPGERAATAVTISSLLRGDGEELEVHRPRLRRPRARNWPCPS